MECPSCSTAIPAQATFCPSCGWKVAGDPLDRAAHNVVKVSKEVFDTGLRAVDRAAKAIEPAVDKAAKATARAVDETLKAGKKAVDKTAEVAERTVKKVREKTR